MKKTTYHNRSRSFNMSLYLSEKEFSPRSRLGLYWEFSMTSLSETRSAQCSDSWHSICWFEPAYWSRGTMLLNHI
jgi:hypothetical protein